MKVTEKGQVTIPKELRDALGLGAGSEVNFQPHPDGLLVTKVTDQHRSRGSRIVERLRGRGDVDMSTEEIMALTRSDA